MNESEDIIITTAAAIKVRDLIAEPANRNSSIIGLRIFVEGGGCSGFSYGFKFETVISEEDHTYIKEDIKFIIDPMSLMYLTGSTIDYVKEIMGEQFTIKNPSVISTCGCGQSFSV